MKIIRWKVAKIFGRNYLILLAFISTILLFYGVTKLFNEYAKFGFVFGLNRESCQATKKDPVGDILLFPADVPMLPFEIKFIDFSATFYFSTPFHRKWECPSTTRLLVIVPLTVNRFDVRNSIRNTWGAKKNLPANFEMFFLVGKPSERDFVDVFERLELEQLAHSDIIVTTIPDTYGNLNLKSYAMFLWTIRYCKSASFLLKTDEDTVIHLPRLNYWLERRFLPSLTYFESNNTDSLPDGISPQNNPTRPLIFGSRQDNIAPIRDIFSRYHISRKLYAEERFPPFVYGPIYLISREAVTNILINAQKVGCFPLEDVLFTGIVRKNANMDIVDVFDHFRTRSEVFDDEPCDEVVESATQLDLNSTESNGIRHVPKLVGIHCWKGAREHSRAFKFLSKLNCKSGKTVKKLKKEDAHSFC